MQPIRTDFRGYEGKFVATDRRTGKVVIADEDPKVVMEKARKLEGVVVGGRVPYADEQSPVVERRRAAAERARGMLGRDPSRSFSDELIAERRAEARAEDREEEARRRRTGS